MKKNYFGMLKLNLKNKFLKRVVCILIAVFFVLPSLEIMTSADGGNWLSGWDYRKPITVSNEGSQLTDYQVKIDVDYVSGHMQSDFGDMRFTGSDGTTSLSYWIEKYTPSSSATVWVKIPNVPSGNSTVYMYYGNASASSESSGDDTFIDFMDHDDASSWNTTGSSTTVTDEGTYMYFNSSGNTGTVVSPTFSAGSETIYIYQDKFEIAHNLDSSHAIATYLFDSGNNAIILNWRGANTQSYNLYYNRLSGSPYYSAQYQKIYDPMSKDTKYIHKMIINDATDKVDYYCYDESYNLLGNKTDNNFYSAGSQVNKLKLSDGTGADLEIKYKVYYYLIRKYASPEPTYLIGSEETTGGCEPALTWREAESWDRSWQSYSGGEWVILTNSSCSDNQYTRQEFIAGIYDRAEWDFRVIASGTYYFWIRALYSADSCPLVKLYWNDEQIGSSKNWNTNSSSYWDWCLFGSKELNFGMGTLKIKNYHASWMCIDNILITDDPDYTPWDKGTQGSTSKTIGVSKGILDYYYIKDVTEELSNVIFEYPTGYLPKGRAFGTWGETQARYDLYTRMNNLNLNTSIEQVVASFHNNDFSTDPSLQGSYSLFAKAYYGSILKRINWIGCTKTSRIDRYFTFSGVSMEEPVFRCTFKVNSIYVDQSDGLENNFRLKASNGKYIGFGHTMDSDVVGNGKYGIRGEFYNGANTFTTPWIIINEQILGQTHGVKVYVQNGVGRIKVGSIIESVSLSGSFYGSFDSFHFELGGVPSANYYNGAEGWFDNFIIAQSLHYENENYFDEPNGKLEVLSKELRINDGDPVECYISPRWNYCFFLPFSGRDQLTYNFSGDDLEIEQRPMEFFDYFDDFIYSISDKINSTEFDENDFLSFFDFMTDEYESYYNFSFQELNESNAKEKLDWYEDVYGEYYCESDNRSCDPFVYIGEDPAFNPDRQDPEYFQWGYKFHLTRSYCYLLERLIWYVTMSHCHGIILYDFNEETYDMNLDSLMALPTFYINGSIGEPIYNNCNNYSIDYYLDQSWNDSVTSYNVIGEIPGINQGETVVVGCLYDSWWNQGTADSAIGIGIVLAVAKYFKDNDITPNRNVRFVAFSGEEYGGRGAYCYEFAHRDEDIVTVIDLNQLGYWQTEFEGKPRQTLNVIVNSESLNSTVRAITDKTDYESKVGNVSDYRTVTTDIFNPFSDYTPFFQSDKQGLRSCDTVCFLKFKGAAPLHPWVLHHRDGQGHTDGDSMKYFDPVDVNVTAEMVWNVTKYFTLEI